MAPRLQGVNKAAGRDAVCLSGRGLGLIWSCSISAAALCVVVRQGNVTVFTCRNVGLVHDVSVRVNRLPHGNRIYDVYAPK